MATYQEVKFGAWLTMAISGVSTVWNYWKKEDELKTLQWQTETDRLQSQRDITRVQTDSEKESQAEADRKAKADEAIQQILPIVGVIGVAVVAGAMFKGKRK